jgi:hypothetical protein
LKIRRRVVSAPLMSTPINQQTRGPPPAYQPNEKVETYLPEFVFSIPSQKFHRDPLSKESTQFYHRIITNLRQLYVLLVLIWADLALLFIEYPFYTIYFLSKSTTRNVMNSIFQFYHHSWADTQHQKCIPRVIKLLKRLARGLVESIAWWYSSWRWEVERLGTYFQLPHWCCKLILHHIGKGSGYMSWQSTQGNYWPFNTREQAFEYLDLEFMEQSSQPSPMARQLPLSILQEYYEEKKKIYLQKKSKPSPLSLPASTLRHAFRTCHGPDAAQLLIDYSGEHYGASFPLGYLNIDGKKSWYHVTLGDGMFGPRVWHRIQYGCENITGIAIGMITDTSYIVVVVPNGPIFLIWDIESDMPQVDDIPYTIASVFPSIANIGMEFQFDHCTEDEDYYVVNWSHGSSRQKSVE